jgi:hypothetical protein
MRRTVASSVLLASEEGLRVEELPIRAIPDLVNNIWLKVDV